MITITVYGMPAPQGSKRFVGLSKAGRGLMIESSAKVKPWRVDVKAAAEALIQRLAGEWPMGGALVAQMVFTLPKPARAPKKRQTWPDKKPDLSKLVRSTEDALSDAGFWADDARVVEYGRLAKVFPGEGLDALDRPGAVIRVWRRDALCEGMPCQS